MPRSPSSKSSTEQQDANVDDVSPQEDTTKHHSSTSKASKRKGTVAGRRSRTTDDSTSDAPRPSRVAILAENHAASYVLHETVMSTSTTDTVRVLTSNTESRDKVEAHLVQFKTIGQPVRDMYNASTIQYISVRSSSDASSSGSSTVPYTQALREVDRLYVQVPYTANAVDQIDAILDGVSANNIRNVVFETFTAVPTPSTTSQGTLMVEDEVMDVEDDVVDADVEDNVDDVSRTETKRQKQLQDDRDTAKKSLSSLARASSDMWFNILSQVSTHISNYASHHPGFSYTILQPGIYHTMLFKHSGLPNTFRWPMARDQVLPLLSASDMGVAAVHMLLKLSSTSPWAQQSVPLVSEFLTSRALGKIVQRATGEALVQQPITDALQLKHSFIDDGLTPFFASVMLETLSRLSQAPPEWFQTVPQLTTLVTLDRPIHPFENSFARLALERREAQQQQSADSATLLSTSATQTGTSTVPTSTIHKTVEAEVLTHPPASEKKEA